MKYLIFLACMACTHLVVWAQEFASKDHYLIDSINVNNLEVWDSTLLHISLAKYHSTESLVDQVRYIDSIVENLTNEFICERYNNWNFNKIQLALENEKLAQNEKEKLEYFRSKCQVNQAYFMDLKGEVKKALKLYFETLPIVKDSSLKASLTISIGTIYSGQHDHENALNFFLEANKISNQIGDKEVQGASSLQLGVTYEELGKLDSALLYYQIGLEVLKEVGRIEGIANAHFNLAHLNRKLNNDEAALEHLLKALEILKSVNILHGIASTCHSIGEIYLDLGQFELAEKYALESYTIAQKIQYPEFIKIAAQLLSRIHHKTGNHEKALSMYKLYIQMRDSTINASNQNLLMEERTKYEYEKQKAIDDLKHEKQIALEKAKQKSQLIISIISGAGALLVLILLIIIYRRLKLTRNQKVIIEEANIQLNQINEEILAQRDQIERQKFVVEEAHSEIKQSMEYAKRIQRAILPPDELIKDALPDSFIFYKPKDIVAGDFYWIEKTGKLLLFAAADCTGHGVPGAMVSVVCHNALNRSVREFGLTDPGLILDQTRTIVLEEFSKSADEVKDGMDLALCSLENNVLKYAGANNPLWIIRKNPKTEEAEIIEIKANKQPVGKFDNSSEFKSHTLEVLQEDVIYLFSDGFVDQFGGPKGKKFGHKRFRQLLLDNHLKPMEEQLELLDKTMKTWMQEASEEQIDDICIVGIRVG